MGSRNLPALLEDTPKRRPLCASVLAALALGTAGAAMAGQTDLSSLPLITSAPQTVLPNLLFVLDDSGSMAWTHMPDTVDKFGRDGSGNKKYGYTSSQCNGVYYNPNLTYTPPKNVDSAGVVTDYPNSNFNAAWVNGYNTSAGTVDLETQFRAWTPSTTLYTNLDSTSDPAQAAYYYTYTGSQDTLAEKNYFDSSTTFYKECASNVLSSPGSGVFTYVQVTSTSGPGATDERQNFANWYSYYRTRMLMMKTATGQAFSGIQNKYRVGYMSINGNADPSFLNIDKFDPAHKSTWFSRLYGAIPQNSTPLRTALSDAGRIYANQISSVYGVNVVDPVQFSCQKNITLLSTDGYWNGGKGEQLDGSAIGNQDASEPRPFNDGGTAADVYETTIEITAATKFSQVTSILVDGKELLSGIASTTGGGWGSRAQKLANSIAAKINACSSAIVTDGVSPDCAVAGYKATASGTTVTIKAPAGLGAIAFTPVVSKTADVTLTPPSPFAGSSLATGGTSETLADVAQYYYTTDLRDKTLWGNELGVAMGSPAVQNDVSPNNVPTSDDDAATWQHMNTFTLGLGVRGRMIYSPTYKSDTSGDYYAVAQGSPASSTVCSWTFNEGGSTCTWPTPGSDLPENIDDLWHAAVNGRGLYFSATDPASLSAGLTSALQQINAMTSDSAAATTSNPNITASNNYIYSSTFRSVDWTGELERRQIDPSTGVVAASADWTAASQLDANTSRTIYTFDSSAGSKLKPFLYGSLSAAEKTFFTSAYMSGGSGNPALTQFCSSGVMCATAAAQAAADGGKLVDFLRGDRSLEGTADVTSKPFRSRAHVLGDIVDSEAVYVKEALYDYVDSGYSAFKTGSVVSSRTPTVYVGANDGMLHAFNANTGAELWAYVPSMLLPTLYRLADKFYASNHQMYVDGSPTVGDAYFGGAWHTVLVGGLNGGGRGYYALDITDPASPKALWEFTHANLGYSFGRPEITKLANGTWVAIFSSGYNNVSPGDGKGYLYVVNLATGALVSAIGTGVGSDTGTVAGVCATAPCPSGLGPIRAWVDNTRYDNTTTKVYGGDLYGNVWRFDVNDTIGPSGREAQNIATLYGPAGLVQSITGRPELGKVAGSPVVYVGTGRYLGGSDLNTSDVQSIYAIKDNGASPGASSIYGNPRSDVGATGFVQQTLTTSTCPAGSQFCAEGTSIRTGTSNAVNFGTQKGWFVDLPGTRERATTDPQLALGTLAVTTNLLNPSACAVGGQSYANFFDYKSGAPVVGAGGMVSSFLGDALATRPVQLKFTDGKVRSLVRMSNNTWQTPQSPIGSNPLGSRRTSWRELIVN
ncbi:MAG: PQQ-binding-like beta-propeller repeat protein [Ideonella sp.]|nr:PQQ-binding-like beta-propeller repeat protein [Ideonella sp.]MCC7457796.1 PQQ-binding-like beta-propeller repeat protein [Nitrospira sp.]